MSLHELVEGVWIREIPLRFMGLVELGTRMTVLRLSDGLLVHSPVPLDAALKAEIDALGPVRFIVAPNLYHHLSAGTAAAAWPEAELVAPAALRKKRSDLPITSAIDEKAPDAWANTVDTVTIHGSMLGETVLYHRPSKTLVTSDLFENISSSDDLLTLAYLKIGGVYGKPGWHRMFRWFYRDRKKAREGLEAILDLGFERIVIAHGDIITTRPHDTLREALAFVLT